MNIDNRATAQAEPTRDVARMLDEHAVKVQALEAALIAGEQSGAPRVFDFDAFMARMRAERKGI